MKPQTANLHIAARRAAHHAALETLRHPSCTTPGLKLWRACVRLERIAHAGATAWCNGETVNAFGTRYNFRTEETAWERFTKSCRDVIAGIFGHAPTGVFINGDARGHALKLDFEKVKIPEGMETDWGGDGILAAEID